MSDQQTIRATNEALEQGSGIVRLAPTWVPRSFCVPGRRLRLDPRDLYALGAHRGGIDERWFASTTHADNGPLTPDDEGLSYIVAGERRVTLRDAIGLLGVEFLGREAVDRHGGWVMYSKFFDNMYPLPHHVHLDDAYAARVGQLSKPEAYFFPPQYNFANDSFPYTFFGLEPGTTREQVLSCLKAWNEGDNRILNLSRAYRLAPGTGWDVPPGILHAPGTLCTYEPQRASDVLSMWQSLILDFQTVDQALLWKDVPAEHRDDYEYLLGMLDWEANVDPEFVRHRFCEPRPSHDEQASHEQGFRERWVVYGSQYFSAKELTVLPRRTVRIADPAAYGTITMQGYGRFGAHPVSAPSLIRYGEMTEDEFFVSLDAARAGVTIANNSSTEPLVMLKHFNPGHPEMPRRD